MRTLLLSIFFVLTFCVTSKAQFLQFSVFVDSEVSASTVQPLDFGQMLQNSEVLVGLDENGSGWFQIAVLNVSDIHVFLDPPGRLELELEDVLCGDETCGLDLELGFAYYIDSQPRLRSGASTRPLSSGFNEIQVALGAQATPEPEYIYVNINVFGRLVIGDVPSGVYTGTLNLEVSY